MYSLESNIPAWEGELREEVAQFYPANDTDIVIRHRFDRLSRTHSVSIDGREVPLRLRYIEGPPDSPVNYDKRNAKLAVYEALKTETGRTLPWGSLTGIRPTRLIYELTDAGATTEEACARLRDVYGVSADKAALLERIVKAQRGAVVHNDRLVSLYVHIPFCTSRCTYCSFVTEVVDRKPQYVAPYTDALVRELDAARRFLLRNGWTVHSVYVGGGTPTALPAAALERILNAARYPVEFTCEAGRPDTITEEKLAVMGASGVTRVSINPQSLVERTLSAIGRRHTAAQFFEAYRGAAAAGFSINTDLIAGLENEAIGDFQYTLDAIAALKPDNVTVHTLSRKNGSALKEDTAYAPNGDVARMTEYACRKLTDSGYEPYYLYRQKRMLGNLENVGYTRPSARCVNNITTMEDCMSVFACGAGAISKRVYSGQNRIERLANVRDVKLYLDTFETRLKKKEAFFL